MPAATATSEANAEAPRTSLALRRALGGVAVGGFPEPGHS